MKNRNEIEERFTWSFADIFEDDAKWESEFEQTEKESGTIASYQGRLGESASVLKEALDAIYRVEEKVEKLYVYAMLRKNVDNGEAKYQTMSGRATNLYVKFSTACAFLSPELLAIEKSRFEEMVNDPILKTYRHALLDTDRERAHTKDGATEEMLAMLSDAAGTPEQAFDMMNDVDMTFPQIRGEGGEKIALSNGTYRVCMESRDRNVRKKAYEAFFGEYRKYINTFAALYAGNVKTDNFYTRVRGYSSACEMALFSDNASVKVYDRLIEAIHKGLPTMRRYLKLRKKLLGVRQLKMYDLYCPMVQSVDLKIEYSDAQKLVLAATEPLGKEYRALLERAFSERWIDVYETRGKTSGAYSCGVYGVHPYVLLNYSGTLDDAFTLAHELGHSMHSYFSDHTQDYANHNYRIMVAEVASTVNEVLLTRYLLAHETDRDRRAAILNHFLEEFRTTVFRQTLFAEFERKAHDLEFEGTPLTADVLNGIYLDLNKLYYKGADVEDLHKIEWARIPHFYRSFYVYQYATGFCSAVAIADRILNEGGAADYLKFLSTGGSDYPLEELKIAGVDLTRPDTVKNALKCFDAALGEFEALLAE